MNEPKDPMNINHLYDSWHYIRSLKFKDKKKLEPEHKRDIFKLINAESYGKFQSVLAKIRRECLI